MSISIETLALAAQLAGGGGGGGGTPLPSVNAGDNGKVLTVVDGRWNKANAEKELPTVTTQDNNKVLIVKNGQWNKDEAKKELPAVTIQDDGEVLRVINGRWSKGAITKELPPTPTIDGIFQLFCTVSGDTTFLWWDSAPQATQGADNSVTIH